MAGYPLGLENLEKWEGIFQSGNFEQTGKVRGNHIKYWKSREFQRYLLFLVTFIGMNCVVFAKIDQVLSEKNKH